MSLRISHTHRTGLVALLVLAALTLSACGQSTSSADAASGGDSAQRTTGHDTGSNDAGDDQKTSAPATRTFHIEAGDDARTQALTAFNSAGPGDTIAFACGFFALNTGLAIRNTEGVTITGCGRDKTILSFRDSDNAEGLLVSNGRGITVSDLTVADTPGDGIKIKSSDIVTYRNVRAMWSSADTPITADNYDQAVHYDCPDDPSADFTYAPDSNNGRYAIYPVQSSNILLANVESIGASDAGIYVGQSDDVIIRNSRALYNVAGYEFENTQRADMHDNVAECNTVGYIIYDLPFLTQYGYNARMHDNLARNNNFDNFANFAKGGIVSQVPPGSGLITLAYDRVEVDHNTFKDHQTGGTIITSYALLGDDGDQRQDIYTEALSIHDNEYVNSGYNPPPPDVEGVLGGDVASLFPTIVRVKNLGVGADILWDGLYDKLHADCGYPTDADGNRVPADDRGKPRYEGSDVQPDCRYNAYKFDDSGQRKKPSMYLCIANNRYSGSPLAPAFANFHGTEGLDLLNVLRDPSGQLENGTLVDTLRDQVAHLGNLLADRDLSPHRCQARYGMTLPHMDDVQLATYTPPESGAPGRPTDEQIAKRCDADTDGINREALAQVDCPNLASYRLFADPQDPSTAPNGNGTPYDLNTRLFSDYAVKYRFVFLPPGEAAQYRDIDQGTNETYVFPVGTVLAKTFSFKDESKGTVRHVETRLLIKREDADGTAHWVGLPYIWHDEDGQRVARPTPAGGTAQVSWYYHDAHSGKLLQGQTDSYHIPRANECIQCHGNTQRAAGAAPIGPKPRNLNKSLAYASGKRNQIAYWVDNAMLTGAPALEIDPNTQIATNVERIPHFNVPGNSGFAAGSDEDIEARVRGYLEVNCAHCHNEGGESSNTGLYLDIARSVGAHYGLCKTPTAAGAGAGGRDYDIRPGDAEDSILPYRMSANDPEIQMPPIARSVVHQQALIQVRDWIDTVVDSDYDNADACGGGGLGLLGSG